MRCRFGWPRRKPRRHARWKPAGERCRGRLSDTPCALRGECRASACGALSDLAPGDDLLVRAVQVATLPAFRGEVCNFAQV
jgi:hypothetical protein